MATITIELPEDVYIDLKSEADFAAKSIEEIAAAVLKEHGLSRRSEREAGREAADRYYSRYKSVFDRLAQ